MEKVKKIRHKAFEDEENKMRRYETAFTLLN